MRYVFVEIFRLFWLTPKTPERPKNDLKNSKNCKIFQFCAIFVKLSINFLALNVENNPKRKKLLTKRLFQRKKCNFLMKKCIKFGPKLTKYLKIQLFEFFMQFLCTFRKTWYFIKLKTFNKEQIRCRGCFFEEIKALGVEKMHQILTEIDKNTK